MSSGTSIVMLLIHMNKQDTGFPEFSFPAGRITNAGTWWNDPRNLLRSVRTFSGHEGTTSTEFKFKPSRSTEYENLHLSTPSGIVKHLFFATREVIGVSDAHEYNSLEETLENRNKTGFFPTDLRVSMEFLTRGADSLDANVTVIIAKMRCCTETLHMLLKCLGRFSWNHVA